MDRKKILNEIYKLTWNGSFLDATKLIKKILPLTSKEATEILKNVGIDCKYSFIKPLIITYGGKIPKNTIKWAKMVLDDKDAIKQWKKLPGRIEAYKFIVKISKQK